jgi:hypothetical protein
VPAALDRRERDARAELDRSCRLDDGVDAVAAEE